MGEGEFDSESNNRGRIWVSLQADFCNWSEWEAKEDLCVLSFYNNWSCCWNTLFINGPCGFLQWSSLVFYCSIWAGSLELLQGRNKMIINIPIHSINCIKIWHCIGNLMIWTTYLEQVMIPLANISSVNPVTLKENASDKYMKIVTVEGHEFWFTGFVNFEKATNHLLNSLSEYRATGSAGRVGDQ